MSIVINKKRSSMGYFWAFVAVFGAVAAYIMIFHLDWIVAGYGGRL